MEKAINEKSSLPVGGDEGQILAKASNQDNDVEWIDNIGQGGGDTLPIGAILPFSGDIIPNGWLLCDGSVIEQEDYPELFEVLAGNYGIINREKIRLPDLRGKVTIGKDSTDADFDTLGNTGGEKTHTLTVNEMPSHSHPLNGSTDYVGIDGTGGEAHGEMRGGNNFRWKIGQQSKGNDQPHNNLQPYIVTNYIIKAKMTIVTVGEVIQENDTATTENVYSATAINNKISTNIITSEEVVTNEYRNGKRVYIRYIIAEVENSSGTSVDINIPSFSYTEMWIDESNSFITNSSETLAINWYFAPDDYSRVWVNKSTGKIRYRMGGNLSGRNFEIVLKYTKD